MVALLLSAIYLASAVVDHQTGSDSMWGELKRFCDSGMCTIAEGSKLRPTDNSTDCHGRMLAYE